MMNKLSSRFLTVATCRTPQQAQISSRLLSTSSLNKTTAFPVAPSHPVGLVSGAPSEFYNRRVRIVHPARTAMQQGSAPSWKIEFDHSNDKWLNPLMGWTSSADTAQQLNNMLDFKSLKEAIYFCERIGFVYSIDSDLSKDDSLKQRKSYADNYKWKGFPKEKVQYKK